MTEKIGKVTLDYTDYPGEDFYCDGAVEDELLEIVKNYSEVEYPRIIEEKKDWPVLYHLSKQRENIVDWIPMEKTAKVLEIGSGCGAITGALSGKAASVTCVDLSKKRSLINAYRHSECENVTIRVGNFKDVEPKLPTDYDYICLIGVFEYGQSYMGTERPYEDFLKIMMKHLAPGGRLIIAIENKFGLKYWAGCQEDHLGTYFSGIENYADGGGVRTFTRKGLERILKACGAEQYAFYYPYPDYKLMTTIYSDEYLPGKGELSNNLRNFDRDRMVLFDEKNAYDGIIEEELFSLFSNSYVLVIGEEFPVKYTKYSNDRAPEYRIKTEISRDAHGRMTVRKYPLCQEAREHIRSMETAYENLKDRYEGSGLSVNVCEIVEEDDDIYASFEFVEGVPLSELMDECLERDDIEGFRKLFTQYVEKIDYHAQMPVADFDLIFANILVQGDTWTLIDYEWTFGKQVATKELAFRAVYCYLLENEKRNKLDLEWVLDTLQMTEEEAAYYREQEMGFQKFVTGTRMSMSEIRDAIGYRMMKPQTWIQKYRDSKQTGRVQIYEDTGNGYSEDASYFLPEAYQGEDKIEFSISVSGNVHMLRIDPAMEPCMVKIKELLWNGQPIPVNNRKRMVTNGKVLRSVSKETGRQEPSVVFDTEDPNINIHVEALERKADNILYASMDIVKLPPEMAADVVRRTVWAYGKG